MEKFKFKTNINCNVCKKTITPFLKKDTRISKWEVDLNSPDKTLSIEGENINRNEIIELISAAGYRIEVL